VAANNHIELVEKGMRVLEALGQDGEASTLQHLAARVGLVKSSVFRILYTFRELGYVEQNRRGVYSLTAKMYALARKAPGRASLVSVVRPHLARMRDESGETASLAEWRRGKVLLVDVAEGRQKLRLSLDVGDDCPLHASALGKAIAAHLPPEELATVLRTTGMPAYTAATVTDRAEFLRELVQIRRRGLAVNREETIEGAILVGAALFDANGTAFAAVSLSCPTARYSASKRSAINHLVRTTSAAITQELQEIGHQAR
jgi:IclR family acetate operon transcriptional repressor